MGGKQMEGDNKERRKKAKQARDRGESPSEANATTGSSKQREQVERKEGHADRVENIRKGKHDVIEQNTPEPRPGYGRETDE